MFYNLINKNVTLKIIQKTKLWFGISAVMIAASVYGIAVYGLNLGIDFTGGTLMELKFEQQVESSQLAKVYSDTLELDQDPLVIPGEENSYIIRTKDIDDATHTSLVDQIAANIGAFEELRFTTIGPTVGSTMKEKAVMALSLAIVAIILFIAFAFRRIPRRISPWKFGYCAIAALVHDVLITLGLFAYLGHFMGVEIDMLFITALLTIMGFSVHDTIVVFDRIRENLKLQDRNSTFGKTANKALNQTMARSINTSLSTLVTLVALLIFASESIYWFVFALVFGILIGTYSSIFIASPLLVAWQNRVTAKQRKK